jgi:hypothetical protein
MSRGEISGLPKRYILGHYNTFRIEDCYTIDPEKGCHLWAGRLSDAGYARARIGGRTWLIYKYVWEQQNGPTPEGYDLHHRCEIKRCINPDHIELLTRAAHAQQHHTLTWDAVREIRALRGKVRQIDLAARFGVPQSTISAVQLGKTWKELAA